MNRVLTAAQDNAIRERYADVSTQQLACDLGLRPTQVYSAANRMGLAKSAAYLASPAACRLRRGAEEHPGRATQFKKGQVPPNKGLRRPGWGPGRMKQTQFKKGEMSGAAQRNYVPVGSFRIVYGNLEQKVTDDPALYPAKRWRPVHRMVWEAVNGPVPAGRVVVFRSGMHTTLLGEITLDRLELVSRSELMRRNSYHTKYPKEIGLAIQLRGQVVRQINKRNGTNRSEA